MRRHFKPKIKKILGRTTRLFCDAAKNSLSFDAEYRYYTPTSAKASEKNSEFVQISSTARPLGISENRINFSEIADVFDRIGKITLKY